MDEEYENIVINAILNYFKAWEYFLIRPKEYYDKISVRKHIASVVELNKCVKKLLADVSKNDLDKESFFAGYLLAQQSKNVFTTAMAQQCALEMLLAGTDTSSVTMYYALVAIASDKLLQQEVFESLLLFLTTEVNQKLATFDPMNETIATLESQIHLTCCSTAVCKCDAINSLVLETLRFKPVGPVVIRQAVNNDEIPVNNHGLKIKISAGEGVIVNLEMMNRRSDLFDNPDAFNIHRFDNNNVPSYFYPFGYVDNF